MDHFDENDEPTDRSRIATIIVCIGFGGAIVIIATCFIMKLFNVSPQ